MRVLRALLLGISLCKNDQGVIGRRLFCILLSFSVDLKALSIDKEKTVLDVFNVLYSKEVVDKFESGEVQEYIHLVFVFSAYHDVRFHTIVGEWHVNDLLLDNAVNKAQTEGLFRKIGIVNPEHKRVADLRDIIYGNRDDFSKMISADDAEFFTKKVSEFFMKHCKNNIDKIVSLLSCLPALQFLDKDCHVVLGSIKNSIRNKTLSVLPHKSALASLMGTNHIHSPRFAWRVNLRLELPEEVALVKPVTSLKK